MINTPILGWGRSAFARKNRDLRHLLILLLVCLGGLATYASPLPDEVTATERLAFELDKLEKTHSVEIEALRNEIKAVETGFWREVITAIMIPFVTAFLGIWYVRNDMRKRVEDIATKWMEKEVPPRCNTLLTDFLSKRFPGDIPHLMEAVRRIAYDEDLRYGKKVRVLSVDELGGKRLVSILKEAGFKQVEFIKYLKGMAPPKADVLLLDRFTVSDAKNELDENGIAALIEKCQKDPNGPIVHYMGSIIKNLGQAVRSIDATTSFEYTLTRNLLDQLRYVFPDPKSGERP
jgi:hypothetical protein